MSAYIQSYSSPGVQLKAAALPALPALARTVSMVPHYTRARTTQPPAHPRHACMGLLNCQHAVMMV
jgi:hypothetical protein